MPKKTSYQDFQRQEMGNLLEQLELTDLCKQSLKSRWLDQVIWADKKADQCRQWHYRLRLTAIVGGVLLPALVGINFKLGQDKNNEFFRMWFPYVPFALSQIIAIAAATEEFLRFGDRWRQYRQLAEELKAEGWEYLQLSGPYQYKANTDDIAPPLPRHRISELSAEDWKAIKPKSRTNAPTTHQEVYTLFAGRIESLINSDVEGYVAALQQQQAKESQQIKQMLQTAQQVSNDRTLFAASSNSSQLPPNGYSHQPTHGYAAMGMSAQPQPFNVAGQPPAPQLPPGYAPAPPYTNGSTPPPYSSAELPPGYAPAPPYTNGSAPPPYAPAPPYTNGSAPPPYSAELPPAYPSSPSFNLATAQPNSPAPISPGAAPSPSFNIAAPPNSPAPISPGAAPSPSFNIAAQPSQAGGLNARILASTLRLRNMSTADGPDGGNNACAWTVNRILQDAGIQPLGDNPNFVPSVRQALDGGRGQQIARGSSKAGDLVIAAGEAHIGIGLTDGCSRVLSNSSSQACFAWESDTDFDGAYGGSSTIYRLIQ